MCLITSVLLTTKVVPKFWRSVIPYLIVTVFVESYCFYLVKTSTESVSTHSIYNMFLLIYLSFHLFLFAKLIALPFINTLIKIVFVALISCYAWEWHTLGFSHFFAITNVLFGTSIIIFSVFYYYSLIYQEQNLAIIKEPGFWFVTGCVLFYAGSTTVNLNLDRLIMISKTNSFPFRYVLISILNMLMYGCWIKSFLCLSKTQTYSR